MAQATNLVNLSAAQVAAMTPEQLHAFVLAQAERAERPAAEVAFEEIAATATAAAAAYLAIAEAASAQDQCKTARALQQIYKFLGEDYVRTISNHTKAAGVTTDDFIRLCASQEEKTAYAAYTARIEARRASKRGGRRSAAGVEVGHDG